MDYNSEWVRKAKEEAMKIRKIPNSDLALIRDQIAKLGSSPAPSQVEDIIFSKAKELGMRDDDLFNQLYHRDKSLLPNAKQASTAEKYKAVLTEGEKQTARNLLSGNIGKAATADMSLAEGLAKSVAPGIAGLVEAIPPMTKYAGENPTASLAETALSPEGSKGIARGAGAMAGMEAGTYLGGLSPVAKGPAMFAGAIAGMAAGAKLADLLTGIPSIDKTIRALYEKELRKREDKMMAETKSSSYLKNLRMADAAPRNTELRPGQ